MNQRRNLLLAFGAAALSSPLSVFAQQQAAKIARIGYLNPERPASSNRAFQQLRQALQALGYVEGKNIVIEYRTAEGVPDRLPALAAELVKLNVDVIIAGGTLSVLAAKRATQTIPIIFPTAGSPVSTGLVASLARPGGNVTGISLESTGVTGKRLELLREISLNASRIAFLLDANNPSDAEDVPQVELAAKKLRVELAVMRARGAADLDNVLEEIARKRVDGVVLSASGLFAQQLPRLASWGMKHRMPIIGDSFEFAEGGCLASYGANRAAIVHRAAVLVDKVLKGAKPADLPVEQPTTFDLIINVKTAKALGITIPQSVLLQATRVVE